MAKLIDGTVKLTGVKTSADRTVCKETVTYRPHGRCWDGEDVNAIVYDLMIIACYDIMTFGYVLYVGEYTAAEMAGKIGYLHQFVEGSDYKTVKIETKAFCCTYHVSEIFAQMAEWEGVMNLPPKKYHRFTVEGKELPKGAKIEPYKRCHGYKPTTVSLAAENTRIAKKFEVLGAMAKSLTSEGMKRALSVLTAIVSIKKLHGYDMGDMADRMLRRKLWRDYGRDDNCQPVRYSARDFEHGPEVWKQVDEAYVKELIAFFRQVLADSPAPEWPKQGDMVQFKNQAKQCKKWQGKLSVWKVYGSLNEYQNRIEWLADICTTKGKHDSMTRGVESLEPWTEPEKPKAKAKKGAGVSKKRAKVAASQQKSVASQQLAEASQQLAEASQQKSAASHKKAAASHKNAAASHKNAAASNEVAAASNEVAAASNEVSLAERLRQALLKLNAA